MAKLIINHHEILRDGLDCYVIAPNWATSALTASRQAKRHLLRWAKRLILIAWVKPGLTQTWSLRFFSRLSQKSTFVRGHFSTQTLGALNSCWKSASLPIGATEEWINRVELKIYRDQKPVRELYDRYKPDLVIFNPSFGVGNCPVR